MFPFVLLFLFFGVLLLLKHNRCKRTNDQSVSPALVSAIKTKLAVWFFSLLLLLSENFELNLGPKCNSRNAFSTCHWNINIISAHNYAKAFLLKVACVVNLKLVSTDSFLW